MLEWGRGPGGRTARRRTTDKDGHALAFDHATPFFQEDVAADPEDGSANCIAARVLRDWEHSGSVAPWEGRFLALDAQTPGQLRPLSASTPRRYVGVPGIQ